MKQDIVLVCRKTEHTIHVCDFLRDHHIDSAIIEDAVDLRAGLSSCNPAFLLLYFEGYSQEECAKKLEIATRTVRRIKDDAIGELTEMYSFTVEVSNRK